MLVEKAANAEADVIERLWAQIQCRTWRRIRALQINVHDGRLVVEGIAPTFYVKQLALRAICDVVGNFPLTVRIEVENNPRPLHVYEVMAG